MRGILTGRNYHTRERRAWRIQFWRWWQKQSGHDQRCATILEPAHCKGRQFKTPRFLPLLPLIPATLKQTSREARNCCKRMKGTRMKRGELDANEKGWYKKNLKSKELAARTAPIKPDVGSEIKKKVECGQTLNNRLCQHRNNDYDDLLLSSFLDQNRLWNGLSQTTNACISLKCSSPLGNNKVLFAS